MPNYKIILFAFCISFFLNDTLQGQYNPNTLVFTKQSRIDSFVINNGIFTHVGGLIIGKYDPSGAYLPSDIHDLSPLSMLTKLDNGLIVTNNPLLKSLHGLHNIDSVGYYGIKIINNDSLLNFNGLSGLKVLEDDGDGIKIIDNNQLDNINTIKNLKKVNNLYVENNNLLDSIIFDSIKVCYDITLISNNLKKISFSNLDTIENRLSIYEDSTLQNFNIKKLCKKFIKDLSIANCPKLKNITELTPIIHQIYITDNDSLKTIDVFPESLNDSIRLRLTIEDNPQLEGNIEINNYGTCSSITVKNNPKLKEIHIPKITSCDNSVYNSIEIINNAQLSFIKMPVLKRIGENLTIKDSPLLQNVNFASLDTIKLETEFTNIGIKDLTGFSKLKSVSLKIIDANALKNLKGLESMKFARNINIQKCKSFDSFMGLDSLGKIGLLLLISDSSLTVIGDLPVIDSVGIKEQGVTTQTFGGILISHCPELKSFGALKSVKFPNYNSLDDDEILQIYDCASAKLASFPNVASARSVNFIENFELDSINVPVLKSAYRNFTVRDNPILKNLGNVRNLKGNPENWYRVRNNPLLNECESICYWLQNGVLEGKIDVTGNASPCDSLYNIKQQICLTFVSVQPETKEQTKYKLTFSPNPTHNSTRVDWDFPIERAQFRVYDTQGVLKQEFNATQGADIAVGELSAGMYFVHLVGTAVSRVLVVE
jgi:hypothetical protein